MTSTASAASAPATRNVRGRGELAASWMRFRRNRRAVVGLVVVALLIVIAVFAPLIAPHNYLDQDLTHRLEPSFSPGHPLGTDLLGRDVLSRMIYSLRTALIIGFGAELLALVVALAIGVTAGYRGGRVDQVLMAGTDIMYAFPSYLFAVIMVVAVGRSTLAIIVAIAVASWVGQARLARAQVLKIKNYDYVEAARSMGAGGVTIAIRYILPNAVGPMLVTTSFGVPAAIAAEAGLSILGLGVAPPTPSWGGMIIEGYQYVLGQPHLIAWPLALFAVTVLAFTYIGDGARDAFDTSEDSR